MDRPDLPADVSRSEDDGGQDEAGPEAMERAVSGMVTATGPLRHVEVRSVLASTNALALDDGREGLLVVALEQTHGRGRHGNRWDSPRGGLYISYSPPPRLVPPRPTDLSLIAALAAADAVEASLARSGVPHPRALLKWPNDVMVGDGKVAGVLVQSRAGTGAGGGRRAPRVVMGIGVNVNARVVLDEARPDDEWPVVPRSLAELAGGPVDAASLLMDLVGVLVRRTGEGLGQGVMEEYRARCHTLGRRVAFTEAGGRRVGTAVDVSAEDGALLVRLEDGRVVRVTAGEVRHVRAVQG